MEAESFDPGEAAQRQEDDPVRLLPDDALAGVLRRLAPRDLAARVPLRPQGVARRHRRSQAPAPAPPPMRAEV
ncbi:hypothetical protein ACP70R_025143 [Stipagrostis hirtigluma subsp. patula]